MSRKLELVVGIIDKIYCVDIDLPDELSGFNYTEDIKKKQEALKMISKAIALFCGDPTWQGLHTGGFCQALLSEGEKGLAIYDNFGIDLIEEE